MSARFRYHCAVAKYLFACYLNGRRFPAWSLTSMEHEFPTQTAFARKTGQPVIKYQICINKLVLYRITIRCDGERDCEV